MPSVRFTAGGEAGVARTAGAEGSRMGACLSSGTSFEVTRAHPTHPPSLTLSGRRATRAGIGCRARPLRHASAEAVPRSVKGGEEGDERDWVRAPPRHAAAPSAGRTRSVRICASQRAGLRTRRGHTRHGALRGRHGRTPRGSRAGVARLIRARPSLSSRSRAYLAAACVCLSPTPASRRMPRTLSSPRPTSAS